LLRCARNDSERNAGLGVDGRARPGHDGRGGWLDAGQSGAIGSDAGLPAS